MWAVKILGWFSMLNKQKYSIPWYNLWDERLSPAVGEGSKPFAVTSVNLEKEESKPHLLTTLSQRDLRHKAF